MKKRKLLSFAGIALAAIGVIASFASEMIQGMNMEEEIREQVREVLAEEKKSLEEEEKIA